METDNNKLKERKTLGKEEKRNRKARNERRRRRRSVPQPRRSSWEIKHGGGNEGVSIICILVLTNVPL